MLFVGLVISGLTARIRLQAETARQREQRTAALYAMSGQLAETGAVEDLVAIAARHIAEVFDAEVGAALADAGGQLRIVRNDGGLPAEQDDVALSLWVLEHRSAS
jgi:two-component system sensor histidine kinase KdpD